MKGLPMVSFLFSTRSLTEFSKNIPIDKNNRDDKDLNKNIYVCNTL